MNPYDKWYDTSTSTGISTSSSSRSSRCQDCGNQAKKECLFERCRSCCRNRGFQCQTHVRSTWIPVSQRPQSSSRLQQQQQHHYLENTTTAADEQPVQNPNKRFREGPNPSSSSGKREKKKRERERDGMLFGSRYCFGSYQTITTICV